MNVKAEFLYSAFTDDYQSVIKPDHVKELEYCSILYKEEKKVKALERLLPLLDLKVDDLDFRIKLNLLIGKILVSDIDYYYYPKSNLLKNKEKGIGYLLTSLSLLKTKIKEERGVDQSLLKAEVYHTLSIGYIRIQENDSARLYINKLINISSLNDDVNELRAKGYTNLGAIFIKKEKFKEAERNIKKAIEIHETLKNNIPIAASYINLAALHDLNKNYSKAKDLYNKALTYLDDKKSLKAMEYRELLFDNIAWALYNLKDYRAYKYVIDSQEIRDSLDSEKSKKDFARIQAENDVKKIKEAANEKEDKLERKTWVIGIVGVVVSLLLLFLANLYKLRQRNLSLKLSQNELRQQRKLDRLKSQTQIKILNATIDGKESERKQIAETLHDNVSALLSSANMHLQASQKQFGGVVPIELQKTQEIIAEASQKIRDLSHNLISSVLLKFGLEYAVKDLAKKFSNSSIKINTAIHNVHRYSEECEIKVFNIIQELVNNILKHSKAENAYVMIEEEDGKLNIIVKDDGKGFIEKPGNETGIGLNHIKARINIMKGHFLLETAIGEGTKVIMNIPVVKKREMVIA